MNESLNKLLTAEVLTEESRAAILESINEAVEAAKTAATIEIKAELAEQFVNDKQNLIEALDSKATVVLEAELAELKESIDAFRDLEVELATKLVEARQELAAVVKNDMKELIESLDAFLDKRIEEEFTELKEDIAETKKLAFGKKILESFAAEYKTHFHSTDDTALKLQTVTEAKLVADKALTETTAELAALKREKAVNKVLESLSGKSREVMDALLKTTPIEKLEETYNKFIPKVLHESVQVEAQEQKESATAPVLAEGVETVVEAADTKIVSGDFEAAPTATEEVTNRLDEGAKLRLKKLAGL